MAVEQVAGLPYTHLNDGTRVLAVSQVDGYGAPDNPNDNSDLTIPAANGFAITPSNSADLPHTIRALYIGAAGDVMVDFVTSGTNVLIKGCTAGTVLPFQVKRVYATGTTATNLLGLY